MVLPRDSARQLGLRGHRAHDSHANADRRQRTSRVIHAPKNGFLYILRSARRHATARQSHCAHELGRLGRLEDGAPGDEPGSHGLLAGPKIVFPATPGARNWHPASYDAQSGVYYASVLDMGNLMFTTPGQKPRAPRVLNNDAVLIFGPDIEAALPTLPAPIQDAVKALPALPK